MIMLAPGRHVFPKLHCSREQLYKIEVMNMDMMIVTALHCGCSTTGLQVRYNNRDLYPSFFADLKHCRVPQYYPIMAGLSGQINHSKPVSRPVTNVINVN